jgi:hypothetical protein
VNYENTIKGIKRWFEVAVPNPDEKNKAVQLACHFEEVGEMLAELGLGEEAIMLDEIADDIKSSGKFNFEGVDRKELLDALCDQIVTAIGTAHMLSMDIIGALGAVDASNWSKFDENRMPIFDANGKIKKGPNYVKVDLNPFV